MSTADRPGWWKALFTMPAQIALIHDRIDTLETRMTTAEQNESAANDRFAALLGTAIAEIKSLRSNVEAFPAQLAQAIADGDKTRADALAADAQRDAERLNAYADQLAELYPQPVPDVEVPDAGQPAEPPVDSGVEVPELPEPVVDVPIDVPADGS